MSEEEKYAYKPWRRFLTASHLIEAELSYFREAKIDDECVGDVAYQCLSALVGLRSHLEKQKQKGETNE